MIHSVRADKASFKSVEFQSGFNVVVAERTKDSTKRDSRNGLGKTSLIEIIHFCLGANTKPNKGLRQAPLHDWTFFLDFSVKDNRYTVSRNTASPGRVIVEGDWSGWPIKPEIDPVSNQASLSFNDWRKVLGWLYFDIPESVTNEKYSPTFRSLISYFIRFGRDAFSIPFEHHRRQATWDKQVNNAFLLGLGWEYARKWQNLKDRDKVLKQLKQVTSSGLIPNLIGTIGDLETSRVRLEGKVARTQEQLSSFQVHPQYEELEERANYLTSFVHQLSNDNVRDRQIRDLYENGLQNEQSASDEIVANMYSEVGLVLPENIVKRLDDVHEFHKQITSDRSEFLAREIQRLRNEISDREAQIQIATNERASIMEILQTHGALEEYTKLQQNHLQTIAELEEIKTRIENLLKFEQEKSNLKIENEQLLVEARSDHENRREIRERAISLFNSNSETLYKSPGKLIIDVDSTGFKFQVEIERSTSQGVEQMKVFSYDLMLAQFWSEREYGPDFLGHDSTIFDGVDERQVALALQLAAQVSEESSFQYICCLNSDLIPYEDFDENFDLGDCIRLELTDDTEDGGLFGIRF